MAKNYTILIGTVGQDLNVSSDGGESWTQVGRLDPRKTIPDESNVRALCVYPDNFSATVPGMILGEAGLSFLGLGIPPPDPTWGGMLSGSGRSYMFLSPLMSVWPGLALMIVVYGLNIFGDALRDLLDPRLRGAAGRYGGARQKRAS